MYVYGQSPTKILHFVIACSFFFCFQLCLQVAPWAAQGLGHQQLQATANHRNAAQPFPCSISADRCLQYKHRRVPTHCRTPKYCPCPREGVQAQFQGFPRPLQGCRHIHHPGPQGEWMRSAQKPCPLLQSCPGEHRRRRKGRIPPSLPRDSPHAGSLLQPVLARFCSLQQVAQPAQK